MIFANPSAADLPQDLDVLVIGGGNAALCAAMTAKEAGAKVLMLEIAPADSHGTCVIRTLLGMAT